MPRGKRKRFEPAHLSDHERNVSLSGGKAGDRSRSKSVSKTKEMPVARKISKLKPKAKDKCAFSDTNKNVVLNRNRASESRKNLGMNPEIESKPAKVRKVKNKKESEKSKIKGDGIDID